MGKYQMKRGGESDPRNKTLMKMFNLIDIGERAGSGVPELFSVWEKEGWEDPVIEERYGEAARTTVILSFNKKATAKTQQQLQEIQTKMRTGKEYKLEEICEITGLKRTRTRDLVKKLVVMGIVDESGDRKARRYKKIKTSSEQE